nr:Extracellular exo-alpha-(1->5)-L-arabinofuranosidaseprecursor [Candidatus Pantoea persica]
MIYFAAAPTRDIKEGLFQHRMYALVCDDADPLSGRWQAPRRVFSQFDSFALEATHFMHQGKNWYLWAQKDPHSRQFQSLLGGAAEPLDAERHAGDAQPSRI